MINKFNKIIHNKYSEFFNFFFFLRYVISIFLLAICIFLVVPKFIDYEKKKDILAQFLFNNYDLEIYNYDSIKFEIFPFPNLSIKNIDLKFKEKPIRFETKDLTIFLNFKDIYNLKNLKTKKIILNNSYLKIDIDETDEIFKYFKRLNNKLKIYNFDLDLEKKDFSILKVKNITFFNYGFKKDKLSGKIFNKDFNININRDNKNLTFKILNTGIKARLDFDKIDNKEIYGISKITVLKNYLKFNFNKKKDNIEILKANFRNKDLSLEFESQLILSPFFEVNSNFVINKIDRKLIDTIDFEKILENKLILKKLNSNNKIGYHKKKNRNSFIRKHILELKFVHGRLIFLSKIDFSDGTFNCNGESLLVDEFPRLIFECVINVKENKNLFKKFEKKISNLKILGSINLLNNKINFKKISIKNEYNAREEDLDYFKSAFENILFDQSFFEIFKKDKIAKFILEVS